MRRIGAEVVGERNVVDPKPTVASEDFACMLQEVPGCYIWLGTGCAASPMKLHDQCFDFNDAMLPVGASLFAKLVERLQPP